MGKDVDATFLRDALAACDMPRGALLAWFEHNEAFCKRHGDAHYREWLELYAECRAALEATCGE